MQMHPNILSRSDIVYVSGAKLALCLIRERETDATGREIAAFKRGFVIGVNHWLDSLNLINTTLEELLDAKSR